MMGRMYPMPDPYDKPFQREKLDMARLTFAMMGLGYRPYVLFRWDTGQRQRVWAKSAEEVNRYAPGDMLEAELDTMDGTAVIVHPVADGGGVNVMGTLLHCFECV